MHEKFPILEKNGFSYSVLILTQLKYFMPQ